MNATHEEWRPVVGYEGFYEVSDQGRVRSLHRGEPYVLKPIKIVSGGYLTVALSRNNAQTMSRIHRLVLLAFVGEAPDGMVACHNDGDPTNNRLSNLRWDTYSENIHDVVRHGNHFGANKTHCPRGHEYSGNNLRVKPSEGRRRCKTCIREYQQRYRAAKLAEGGAR